MNNKLFLFYSSRFYNLKKYIINETSANKYSFFNLLKNYNLNLLLKINKLKNFEYFYEFYYDNLSDVLDIDRSVEGFRFAMRKKSNKFSRNFKFIYIIIILIKYFFLILF